MKHEEGSEVTNATWTITDGTTIVEIWISKTSANRQAAKNCFGKGSECHENSLGQ
jgi:hypothetical protein